MRSKSGKYLYRWLCSFVLLVGSTALFTDAWYDFVKVNNQTGHLLGIANIGMAVLIYAALFAWVGRWMHAFKIGVERTANLMASGILTILTVDVAEVFISLAITGQFRFFFDFLQVYIPMFVAQVLIYGFLLLPMIWGYRRLFKPLTLVEIHGVYRNHLAEKLTDLKYKYKVVDSVDCTAGTDEIRRRIADADAVLINDVPSQMENRIIKECYDLGKRAYLAPKLSDIIIKASEELNVVDTPLFLNRNIGLNLFQRILKRVCDVAFSFVALVVLSPLMIVIAAAIHAEDHGPVFFRQERCTINNRRFIMLKFRSMVVDAEKDGAPHPAGVHDERITRVGRMIRSARLDELPQLFNILKGDMSIVGPRPERIENVELYTREIPEFAFRAKVKGGLTGYAQVYGKYNTSALDKLKLDLMYIVNYSFLLDIQILFETLKILFQRESTEGFSEEQIDHMKQEQQEPPSAKL